jgi:hypothetical protein
MSIAATARACGAGYSGAGPKPAARGEELSHAVVAIGALYEPTDRPADTFRTSLLELMMSVHWVKADIAVASVEI